MRTPHTFYARDAGDLRPTMALSPEARARRERKARMLRAQARILAHTTTRKTSECQVGDQNLGGDHICVVVDDEIEHHTRPTLEAEEW